MVTCPMAGCRACHVPLHRPSFNDTRLINESPFEKPATTDPATIGFPQSSITCVSTATGHEAGTLKPAPNDVTTGSSFAGVQPGATGRSPTEQPAPNDVTTGSSFAGVQPGASGRSPTQPLPTTTSSRFTVRELPSWNSSVSTPLRIPGLSPVRSGCTTIFTGWSGVTVALPGRCTNQFCPSDVNRPEV